MRAVAGGARIGGLRRAVQGSLRHIAVGVALLLGAGAAQAAVLKATLLQLSDDPRLERARIERAYLGHPLGSTEQGIRQALADTQFELESAGSQVALSVVDVPDAVQAILQAKAAERAGATLLLADLPPAALIAVADAVRIPVLNLTAPEDHLRGQNCRARLWHLMPSERMRADAVAQWLTAHRWSTVLLLVGPTLEDAARAQTVEGALKRYGLKTAARRPFKVSADPRERDLANPLLLTASASYDAIWVVDSDGEFARSLPYRTVLPRPVVGDAGLTALAWHPQFERFGAPQIVRRFVKEAKRPMAVQDWTGWLAGRLLSGLATSQPKATPAQWAQALPSQALDGSKGIDMSFRPWDGQLRQPMLLTDGQGVVGQAPVDGLLHPKDTLDTLGADAPEALCKVTR